MQYTRYPLDIEGDAMLTRTRYGHSVCGMPHARICVYDL